MKLQEFAVGDGWKAFRFWCPGCSRLHRYDVRSDGGRPNWSFSGSMEQPSFSPSLLYPDSTPRCHLYLTNGELQFLNDCGHSLAGKTVPLPEIPEGELE